MARIEFSTIPCIFCNFDFLHLFKRFKTFPHPESLLSAAGLGNKLGFYLLFTTLVINFSFLKGL